MSNLISDELKIACYTLHIVAYKFKDKNSTT